MTHIAEQLKAAGVPSFPCWARFNESRGRWDKGPSVPRGEAWATAAERPFGDPALNWSSGVIGVPIPPGVVVLDLDLYKGATRADVEAYLGCALPWDAALVQRTIGGGEHYAFRCDWNMRQGDSLGVAGFDTRVAGKGFICSGRGYSPVGFGVFALAYPARLPMLPDAAREKLERHEAPAPERGAALDADDGEILDALRHIDPGCSRAEWVRVGLAIRHQYQADELKGSEIFDRWSAGEFWPEGEPDNYVLSGPGSPTEQFGSFKPEGGTTIATLFFMAMQGGWHPPANFNTAAAFGPDAVSAGTFSDLVDRIRRDGCDIRAVQALVDDIRAAGCNALQVALLAAELKAELKGAGVQGKTVAAHIDSLLQTRAPSDDFAQPGQYGKSDPVNAATFVDRYYPDGVLVRADGEFYRYGGKAWELIPRDTIEHQIAVDMTAHRMQNNRITACTSLVLKLVRVRDGEVNQVPPLVLIFDNGILDLPTGKLYPHDKELFSTNLLPYAWRPDAVCPLWLTFLDDVFGGDQERIALLQEWFGYLMTRSYSFQKIMLMLGPKRCGKGTIGRVLQHLVGKGNFTGGSLSSFAADSFLASLRTKTVIFIGDAEKKVAPQKVNQVIERMKTISGNDEVAFDRKFLSGLSETFLTRITIASNSIPNLFDDSGALASRLLVLPFYKSYYDREDLGLSDRLLAEIEGVAAWAIEGWQRLQANGRFTHPSVSQNEIQLIREAYSPIMRFVAECCEVADGNKVTSKDLYEAYRAWALGEGEEILRPKTFTGSLRDSLRGDGVSYGVHRFPDGGRARGFSGLALKADIPNSGLAAAFQPRVVK